MHSPIRYAWDLQHQYLHEASLERGIKAKLARMLLHYMRMWDQRTASGVDEFIANSHFIGRRINKSYRRQSTVIYPPVDTRQFTLHEAKEDFYLTASRMVPYKKIPLIIEAFAAMPDKRLIVIGTGPEMDKAREVAGPNVTLLGYQSFEVLLHHMQRAKGFVFAAEEDFGIAPIEAQACGTPVIAYGRGGVLETVRGLDQPEPTGVFYPEQTTDSIIAAIAEFEANRARITLPTAAATRNVSPASASSRKSAPSSRPACARPASKARTSARQRSPAPRSTQPQWCRSSKPERPTQPFMYAFMRFQG